MPSTLLRALASPLLVLASTLSFARGVPPALAPAVRQSETGNPALTIDGEEIAFDTFAAWLVAYRGEAALPGFLATLAIEREARARGITVADGELEARIEAEIDERVRAAFAGDRAAWSAELERLGGGPVEFRARRLRDLRPQVLADRILASTREVGDEDVRALFEARFGSDGRRLWVRALSRKLLVDVRPGSSMRERQEANRRAQEALRESLDGLRARLVAGADFETLAREAAGAREGAGASDDTERTLPHLFQFDLWPARAVEVVRALQPDEISEPVYGLGSFHLFQLVRQEVVDFDEWAPRLREELRTREASAQEVAALIERSRANTRVEQLPALLEHSTDMGAAILRIDERDVTRGEYGRWLVGRQGRALARSFVEERLMNGVAARLAVEISPDEVEARIDFELNALIDRFHRGDRAQWEASLAAQGKTPEQVRRERRPRTRLDLQVEAVLERERVIEEGELRHLWRERYGKDGRALELRWFRRQIRLPAEAAEKSPVEQQRMIAEATARVRDEVLELRQRVLDGQDFATLIRTHSDEDATRERGGRPAGPFHYWRWPENARAVFDALAIGELSTPVQVGDAFFLFELLDERHVPFDAVAEALEAELAAIPPTAAQRAGYLNALVERTPWSVHAETF